VCVVCFLSDLCWLSKFYKVVQYWTTFLRVNVYVHAHVHIAAREQHRFVRVVNMSTLLSGYRCSWLPSRSK